MCVITAAASVHWRTPFASDQRPECDQHIALICCPIIHNTMQTHLNDFELSANSVRLAVLRPMVSASRSQ